MYCEVFRYHFEGAELPTKEAVRLTRRVGEFVYMERIHDPRPGRSLMLAMLLSDDRETYLIPALDRAHLFQVRGGICVEGVEVIPRGRSNKNIKSDDYPQRWFCRPVPRPAAADAAGVRLEARRHADDISATLTRRSTRRVPYDPATASGNSPGYF